MLDGGPEIHGHGTDLQFRLDPFGSVQRLDSVVDDQMIAAVAALFDLFQIFIAQFVCLFTPIELISGSSI